EQSADQGAQTQPDQNALGAPPEALERSLWMAEHVHLGSLLPAVHDRRATRLRLDVCQTAEPGRCGCIRRGLVALGKYVTAFKGRDANACEVTTVEHGVDHQLDHRLIANVRPERQPQGS